MASRGSAGRRMQGNPLGGILRDLDRRSRVTTRGAARRDPGAPVKVVQGPPGPPGKTGPPGPGAVVSGAVVVTGDDGRARWDFPSPYATAPVVSAVAVDPDPGGPLAVMVVLEVVDVAYVVVRVWRTRPLRGAGVVEPVGAGVSVHVTAAPLPFP